MDAPVRACVVVPTYNEKENVGALVEAIEAIYRPGLSLLFVDDSSPDGTADEVRKLAETRPWVRLLVRHGGRSFALSYQEGFKEAIAQLQPMILVGMDSDLQHPPSAIPALVGAIETGADVAVASRYVEGGRIVGWSLARRIVSTGANLYARWLLRLPVKDCTSGFRAYNRPAAEEVASACLRTKRFEYQIATLNLLKRDRKIVEVPYTFMARRSGQSKFSVWYLPRFFFAVARMALG